MENFPYQHIVVDEGQDFDEDRGCVLEKLKHVIDLKNEREENASFYLFYDRNQLVQANDIPNVIMHADCKLTLFCNCRNSTKIAKTLSNILNSANIKIKQKLENQVIGDTPNMSFAEDSNDTWRMITQFISSYRKNNVAENTIVILTAIAERENFDQDTEKNSAIAEHLCSAIKGGRSHYYINVENEMIPVTTCRKFKGLESDCVIIIDIDEKCLSKSNNLNREKALLYVGASRARTSLYMIVNMSNEQCVQLTLKDYKDRSPRAPNVIAGKFCCKLLE